MRIDTSSGRKLGISMDEHPGDGVWITKINPTGLGYEHPTKVKVGQKITSVNGTDTTKATKAEVIALVKSSSQHVDFTFLAPPPPAASGSNPFADSSNPFAAPPASAQQAAPKKPEAPKEAASPKKAGAPKKAASPKKAGAPKKEKGLVRIDKTSGKKLGISMDGQPGVVGSGMFVTKIVPAGLAAGYPECKVGAKIAAVNGTDCSQATKKQVIDLIKQNADFVDIKFSYPKAAAAVQESAYGTASAPEAGSKDSGVCIYKSPRGDCSALKRNGDYCMRHACPACGNAKGSRQDLCDTCGSGGRHG